MQQRKHSLTNRVPVRWTVPDTSANTGGYNYFAFPLRERKMQIDSFWGAKKAENLGSKVFGFFIGIL